MVFKSERAAKMAFTKAEKAWKEIRGADTTLLWERREKMEANGGSMARAEYEDYERRIAEAKRLTVERHDVARKIYDAATSQGFYIRSYEFSAVNVHRDLVAMNMD